LFIVILHDNEPRGSYRAAEGYGSEVDKFAARLYQARRQYRRTCERPNKGNKAIGREVISSYQIAQSLGFNGDFRENLKSNDQHDRSSVCRTGG
jgi:hypothetical protein